MVWGVQDCGFCGVLLPLFCVGLLLLNIFFFTVSVNVGVDKCVYTDNYGFGSNLLT